VKVGDLVKYRQWRQGDPPLHTVEPAAAGWNRSGVVLWLGQAQFGSPEKEPAVEYLSEEGHYVTAAQKDVFVIRKAD
jgi:hypothetical protein